MCPCWSGLQRLLGCDWPCVPLTTWHDLSDMRLADALDDRASVRRLCGFAAHEPTPERTAFVRLRAVLVRGGLDRALFEAVTRQFDARGVVVRTAKLVDVTLIASASVKHDGEARWAEYRRRKPVHGDKAHVATGQDAELTRGVAVTTANVHDAAELEAILPEAPGDTYGDSAYSGSRPEGAIRARGGTPRVVHTGTWGGPDALERLREHNREVRRVRARIEAVFGTAKRFWRLAWVHPPSPEAPLRWSVWRRQHQQRARRAHWNKRLRAVSRLHKSLLQH